MKPCAARLPSWRMRARRRLSRCMLGSCTTSMSGGVADGARAGGCAARLPGAAEGRKHCSSSAWGARKVALMACTLGAASEREMRKHAQAERG